MTAFQIRTFIPQDGIFSITLPEHLRGKNVQLRAEPDMPNEESEDVFTHFCKNFRSVECSSMSDDEYITGIRSLRGILTDAPDLSDLRDETERTL